MSDGEITLNGETYLHAAAVGKVIAALDLALEAQRNAEAAERLANARLASQKRAARLARRRERLYRHAWRGAVLERDEAIAQAKKVSASAWKAVAEKLEADLFEARAEIARMGSQP